MLKWFFDFKCVVEFYFYWKVLVRMIDWIVMVYLKWYLEYEYVIEVGKIVFVFVMLGVVVYMVKLLVRLVELVEWIVKEFFEFCEVVGEFGF